MAATSRSSGPGARNGSFRAQRATLRGIRRSVGIAPNKKTPATADDIIAMVPSAGPRLADLRDRALFLLGFTGAFRRSELVALDAKDIEQTAEGLRVEVRRSKTDPAIIST